MIYQTLQIARFNPLPFSITIYFERQGIFKNALLCYNMNCAEAQAGEDNILKYQWETAPDIYIGDDLRRRFVLGVSGNHPRHPPRLPLSAKSVSFDVTHYWAE